MSSQSLYINTIDECVNNIIDTYYLEHVESKNFKSNIKKNNYIIDNFKIIVDSMKNTILSNVKSLKIDTIIDNKNQFDKILLLLDDYLLLYFFFYLGTLIDLTTIINILNKLSNTNESNFFKNRYLSQYTIYFKYIILLIYDRIIKKFWWLKIK